MLTIGSRGSQLALWQARWVAARLEELGSPTRIEIIKTTGDKITGVALSKVGSKGLFTKELEDALIERRIDLAVHSLKDMPTDLPDGLELAAIPVREDPRDALLGQSLDALAPGARVGTSSLRRAAQILAQRPDLKVEPVRGNLDTRIRKLDEGQYDSIVLAAAGLRRLGWGERIAELLSVDVMCPAAGQGALAVETRDGADPARAICARLDDAPTRLAITAERALLAGLGGGCQVPIGAHARITPGLLVLRGIVLSPDGSRAVAAVRQGAPESAAETGSALAKQLLASGAADLLRSLP